MTAHFQFDPSATYDVRPEDQRNPVWRIQNRRVYAYLEHDPRRDWSGDIGIVVLSAPQKLVDHDGHDMAFIDDGKVRCVDGRKFGLYKVKA
jgi:hypothetical protein